DEEPLELGGSTVESLELEEDDLVSLEEEPDYDANTQLKADDDFLLTPLEDSGFDDTDDSGSQVIALDSESFDDSANTMLGNAAFAAPLVSSLDAAGAGDVEASAPGAAPLTMMSSATVPEAPY